MATARETTDHDEIREWVESRGGKPAQVEGTGGMLRIDFGDPEQRLEPIDWDRFFEIFDESGLGFLYDPEGHMNKFIQVSRDQRGIGKTEPDETDTRSAAARGARGSRKKSGGTRKKTSSGSRKKSSGSRKKSTSSSRKKSGGTSRKKSSSASRKKSSSASRKKSSSASRKKSSSASRKKSGSTTRKKSGGTSRKKTSTSRKKSSSKKTSGKKSSSKKSSSKKSAGKKSSSKKSGGRKYGRKAGRKVERAMHEMKRGQLRSGSKGPKVKSRKQAIAIGLSEARREGDKVPRRKGGRKKKR